MKTEPVFVGGISATLITTLILALLTMAKVMGWWDLSEEQTAAIMAVVFAVTNIAASAVARNYTTSTADPKAYNKDGKLVKLVPEDGSKLPK